MSVYFEFTAEQYEFRDGLRDLLQQVCAPEVVRSAWDAGNSPVPGLWKQLGDLGLLGLLAPANAGGLERGETDLVLLLEECGRFAVPGPLGEHVAVGVPALASAGAPELAAALAGDAVVGAQERATAAVRWATLCDLVVQVGTDGLSVARQADLALETPQISVDLSMMPRSPSAGGQWRSLPAGDAGLARGRGTLAAAAQLLGLADRMMTLTVEHVRTRTQFGTPVGSRQAVKHLLATALIALEHARPVVYRAAWVLEAQANAPDLAVSFAKIYATRAADLAARTALQCHGAVGYSWEHDLHLWMKRVWALAAAWGAQAEHEDIVATAVLGAV